MSYRRRRTLAEQLAEPQEPGPTMHGIAQDMEAAPRPSESAENQRHMTASGLAVTYQRNDATRVIIILEIRPLSPKP